MVADACLALGLAATCPVRGGCPRVRWMGRVRDAAPGGPSRGLAGGIGVRVVSSTVSASSASRWARASVSSRKVPLRLALLAA